MNAGRSERAKALQTLTELNISRLYQVWINADKGMNLAQLLVKLWSKALTGLLLELYDFLKKT